MSPEFATLLDATLRHLRDLQERGVQFVNASPEILARLNLPAARAGLQPVAGRTKAAPNPAGSPETTASAPRRAPAPAPAAPPTPVAGTDRGAAMAEIRSRALVCVKCPHLAQSRTQVVFGVGSHDAELMFVGEAPGAEEDRRGEPFVGPAGQLLTRIIGAMGYSRESVYIANILKCRPDMPAGQSGNRPPRPDEMDRCKPYLISQVEIIRPRVIVALGLTAVQGLLGVQGTMGSLRGRWQEFRGIPVMPTYHPSYLVRAEEAPDRGHSEKRKTWEDMLKVLERLERPITPKMQGYFLKTPSGTA